MSAARHKSGIETPGEGDVILVIGDFVVDEHWPCGVHRTPHSTRSGQSHLRVLTPVDSSTKELAGAGATAAFLHSLAVARGGSSPAMLGMGFWRIGDDQALKALFYSETPPNNLYSLSAPRLTNDARGLELLNMHEAYESGDGKDYTTRIIRMYENRPGGHLEFNRLDWEPRDPDQRGVPSWNLKRRRRLQKLFRERLKFVGGRRIHSVVISDLRKGVISKTVIDWVKSVASGATWYVSTKEWQPKWLSLIPKGRIRLFFVPQAPAEEATTKGLVSQWLTRREQLSREAINQINELARHTECENVVVLPHGFSAISWSKHGAAYVHPARGEQPLIDFGIAGMVFSSVIAGLNAGLDCGQSVSLALNLTRQWTEQELKRITQPSFWHHGQEASIVELPAFEVLLVGRAEAADVEILGGKPVIWEKAHSDWQSAHANLGIVTAADGLKQLQLWRSMSEVDGYVCLQEPLRRSLNALVQGVNAFAKAPRHHEGCLIVGPPGSGKTFLAKRLADTAGLKFVEFNLTQIRTRAELSSWFGNVLSIQRSTPETLMVFIDEVNHSEGGALYGAFLTPLDDGSFRRDGNLEKLEPCYWVFAGTVFEPKLDDKSMDLESRLTGGVVRLSQGNQSEWDSNKAKLERVYVGAMCIKREFPEVTAVSEPVLEAFTCLDPEAGLRSIRQFVARFADVQFGGITSRNLPAPEYWPGARGRKGQGTDYQEWVKVGTRHEGVREIADVQLVER